MTDFRAVWPRRELIVGNMSAHPLESESVMLDVT